MSDLFNVSTNPHVRSKDTTQTIMRDVLIALTPASIFGIYNFGLGALLRIVIGIAVCVAAEGAYQYFMHKKVTISDKCCGYRSFNCVKCTTDIKHRL